MAKGKKKTKSCKITTWTMNEISFLVPLGLASGKYPLKVINSVSEKTGEFKVLIP